MPACIPTTLVECGYGIVDSSDRSVCISFEGLRSHFED